MASNTTLYNAVIALNPAVYWVLNESSGNPIQQGSSTVSNLTLSGSYTHANTELITGDSTKFLSFTAGKGTATRGNLTLPFGSFSATFLIKVPAVPTQQFATIFSVGGEGDTQATNYQIIYRFNTYPAMNIFWEYDAGSDTSLSPDTVLYRNLYDGTQFQTKHVTLVKDSTIKSVYIYINGYLRETLTYVNEPTGGTSSSFFLGGSATTIPDATLTMTMGHFAFFQRVLTLQEIVGLAKASGVLPESFVTTQTEFQVLNQLATEHATLASTKSILEYPASKLLTIALDPLIDPNLLQGSEAYATE